MNEFMPAGMRLSFLNRYFKKQMDIRLKDYDLTGVQFGVLGALVRLEQSGISDVNQRDLEKISRVTHPTMTEIIKRLEKKEYIVCCQSQKDKRNKCISSAEKARQLRQEIQKTDEKVFKELSEGLSEEQVAQFFAFTDKMLSNAYDKFHEGSGDCLDKKACTKCQGV